MLLLSFPLFFNVWDERGEKKDKEPIPLSYILQHSDLIISIERDRLLCWTFFDGQIINHTLRYGIQMQRDCKIVTDTFKLKIEIPKNKVLFVAIA